MHSPSLKMFVAAIRDITNRKRDEYELKRYALGMEGSNRIKDLFSDVMRHDLPSPAGVIRDSAEILYDKETSREKREIIGMVRVVDNPDGGSIFYVRLPEGVNN